MIEKSPDIGTWRSGWRECFLHRLEPTWRSFWQPASLQVWFLIKRAIHLFLRASSSSLGFILFIIATLSGLLYIIIHRPSFHYSLREKRTPTSESENPGYQALTSAPAAPKAPTLTKPPDESRELVHVHQIPESFDDTRDSRKSSL